MRLVMLGVRGSTPAPGTEFVRYGGHTSCVAVVPDGSDVPRLVLDAGTGLRDLTGLLKGEPFHGTILLSHLHWDHVQGLPFCRSADRPEARVDLVLPAPAGDPEAVLARFMSPPLFPIDPTGLRGDWRFHAAVPDPRAFEGFTVTQAEIVHKGGTTLGTRIEANGLSVAYLPDHAPQLGSAAAETLAAGVDLLLHDGQFLPSEQDIADAYGHATVLDAIDFAARCGARRLVLIHHSPGRTDDDLDAIAKEFGVELASQGQLLAVDDSGPGPARVGRERRM